MYHSAGERQRLGYNQSNPSTPKHDKKKGPRLLAGKRQPAADRRMAVGSSERTVLYPVYLLSSGPGKATRKSCMLDSSGMWTSKSLIILFGSRSSSNISISSSSSNSSGSSSGSKHAGWGKGGVNGIQAPLVVEQTAYNMMPEVPLCPECPET